MFIDTVHIHSVLQLFVPWNKDHTSSRGIRHTKHASQQLIVNSVQHGRVLFSAATVPATVFFSVLFSSSVSSSSSCVSPESVFSLLDFVLRLSSCRVSSLFSPVTCSLLLALIWQVLCCLTSLTAALLRQGSNNQLHNKHFYRQCFNTVGWTLGGASRPRRWPGSPRRKANLQHLPVHCNV